MNADHENEMELEIKRLEQEWDHAQLKNDTEELDQLLSEDFIATVGDDIYTKTQVIEKHRSTEIKLEAHESTPESVRVYRDAAVVVGHATAHGHYRGQDVRARSRYTRVYVKQQEKWRLVAAHAVVKWE